MDRYRPIFLGYRIYRIKFIKIVGFVFLISAFVFWGVIVFLLNTWMNDLWKQAQDAFMEREKRLGSIRQRVMDYTNGMYEDAKLMEDTKALFEAHDEAEYIQIRRENSLGSNTQIGYLPANIKKKLFDSQNQIAVVTLESDSGVKVLWMEYGNIRFGYGAEKVKGIMTRYGRGDIMVANCAIRNPKHISLCHAIPASKGYLHNISRLQTALQCFRNPILKSLIQLFAGNINNNICKQFHVSLCYYLPPGFPESARAHPSDNAFLQSPGNLHAPCLPAQ